MRKNAGKAYESNLEIVPGGGEMGERMRAKDWLETPLGSVGGWS